MSLAPVTPPSESNPDAEMQVYAWSWFSLHSGQHMQMINFWLVAVAFFVAAFVHARTANLTSIAVGICVAGATSSIAFALLDARTRRLVQVGEDALSQLEDKRAAGAADSVRLVTVAHSARASRVVSYRVLIEGLQIILAILFAAAGLLTALTP